MNGSGWTVPESQTSMQSKYILSFWPSQLLLLYVLSINFFPRLEVIRYFQLRQCIKPLEKTPKTEMERRILVLFSACSLFLHSTLSWPSLIFLFLDFLRYNNILTLFIYFYFWILLLCASFTSARSLAHFFSVESDIQRDSSPFFLPSSRFPHYFWC